MILQTPFYVAARKLFDDGIVAGKAIEQGGHWFHNHDAVVHALSFAHLSFERHFDVLMDRIREKVQQEIDHAKKTGPLTFTEEEWQVVLSYRRAKKEALFVKTYSASPEVVRRELARGATQESDRSGGNFSRSDSAAGTNDASATDCRDGAMPCAGGQRLDPCVEREVPTGMPAGGSELRSVALDHSDRTGV